MSLMSRPVVLCGARLQADGSLGTGFGDLIFCCGFKVFWP
jgi:hypothetical protein